MKFCDLHVHSHYSDGTLSPSELIRQAQRIGLSAIALTDHNTTAGLAEFSEAAAHSDVKGICGIELSTDYEDLELHILALYVEPRFYDELEELVSDMHKRKDAANFALIEALRRAGMDITYDEVEKTARGHINRAHVADVLRCHGYASSVKEAFDKYLVPRAGFYTPPKRLDALEAIKYIRSIGAVSVLAHPFLSFDCEDRISRFLEDAKGSGLAAMETMYSTYTPEQSERARALAQGFSLAESGGSDYHADKKPHISLGTGCGDLFIPDDIEKTLSNLTATYRRGY